ncbi:RidA family protein [Kribbella capetownensis]|uniref:RidA family protein n=1 Tax=Kribbella capetownensis TaxID=1572659 RepID=A0A4R0J030_9ACTN|nr:RidA family protein [Kribbella capetownensis]TCC37406.1 RidA family protein [Kribbella capetownensis]
MSTTSEVRRRLAELGLCLPPPSHRHEYLPFVAENHLIYVAGHAPFSGGDRQYRGRVGDTLDLSDGRAAARLAVLGCLASLETAICNLDALTRIVKVNGYVHCVPGYEPLPEVMDGASELLVELFGERGRHARTTVGVASLPGGVAVEIEMVAMSAQHGALGRVNTAGTTPTTERIQEGFRQ